MLRLASCPSANSSDLALAPVALPAPAAASYTVVNGSTLVAETNSSGVQAAALLTTLWPAFDMLAVAAPGETHAFLAVVRTSVETPAAALVDAVQADWAVAQLFVANGTLHSSHVAELEATIWGAGVELGGGRADLARIANASLAAIVGSMREDRAFAPSSSGLSGAGNSQTGYNGHVFWDNSLWWGPVMATILPDLAAGLIDYRRERLDGAYEKARSYSPPFSGAMWPWESASTGTEVCPSWAPTGLREIHISGDVACFVWWLFRMQQQGSSDLTWLRETAWPILAGTADFWLSRATTRDDGSLSIDDLIPPDEYADHVNNSAFTNAVAKLTLRHAVDAAALLGVANASVAAWRDADARLSVPYNAGAAWHPEYDGYVQGTVIKQADVVLLGFPLQFADATMTPASRENDLDIYFRASDPGGPAMTWSMHAIGFAELGNQTAAGEMLNLTIANAHGDFGVWRETPSGGCPNFITGAAGYLQALLFGYPRLRLNDTALTFSSPMLVDGATSHAIRGLAYLGNRIDVSYDAASITFALQSSAACAAPAIPARRYRAAPPASQGVSLQHALRSSAECQRGRVAIGGRVVEPRALVVTTGDGVRHALAPGSPVTLPVADVFVVSAADAAQAPLAALAEARR
jgi:trehalose/maltose hydrolase-like predicted phosphorylase